MRYSYIYYMDTIYNGQYNRRRVDHQPFGPILSTCHAEPGECSLKTKLSQVHRPDPSAILYEILENPQDK